jgi:hypothetical protein
MADVVRPPGVFEQVWLVASLRWSILKHGLRRKNNVWDLIGMIWVGIFSGLTVIGLAFAFYEGGYQFVAKNRVEWMALLFWAIFLWWQFFPILIAGFGTNFDFATLLRFPLSLRAFYLLGLGYGLSDFAALSSTCWLISMMAGASSAKLSLLPAMAAVIVLFVVMNVSLERLIGSWLEKLLAKRKAREVFIGIFVMSMVSLNFLNPLFQRWGQARKPKFLEWIPYLHWLPGSLAGNAVARTASMDHRGYWLAMAGLFAWAVVVSVLLWRRYAALYSGEMISESMAPVAARKRIRKTVENQARAELLSPQVAAMFGKELHYLTRNGFAFLTLILPPFMVFFFTFQFGPGSLLKEHSLKPAFFFPGILAYLVLILISPAYNSFAFESRGIQSYFMSPVRFRDVLLGKNLFLFALVGLELAFSFALLIWRVGWPGTAMFVSTIMAGIFAVVGQLPIANWSSLSFPKKMEIGKMKGQRNSGVAVWTAFGVQIVLGGICALVLFIGQWTRNPWLPAVAFAALAVAALGGYAASLNAMNGLAEQKKELLIETLTR